MTERDFLGKRIVIELRIVRNEAKKYFGRYVVIARSFVPKQSIVDQDLDEQIASR
jgi:hypothetical protein